MFLHTPLQQTPPPVQGVFFGSGMASQIWKRLHLCPVMQTGLDLVMQSSQGPPPLPQSPFVMPGLHAPPEQHPEEQATVQVVVVPTVHLPVVCWHFFLDGFLVQSWQVVPLTPHSLWVAGWTHLSLALVQQPLQPPLGSQVQACLLQIRPPVHELHLAPPFPQLPLPVPARH